MAAFRASTRNSLPEPEINVTPLVDVVLVLLIIFMVITPALNEGEHVELPAINEIDKKAKEDAIDLTLALGGIVLLEKQRIAEADLRDRLVQMHDAQPDRKLMLKADTALPYKKIRETFAMAREIGFRGVALKVEKHKPAPGA